MSLSSSNAGRRRIRRAAIAAALAVGAAGALALGASAVRADTRCVAQATTVFGRIIDDTHAAETRRRPHAACRAALDDCEARLDHKRRRGGFPFPLAECHVMREIDVADRRLAPRIQCDAQAFTRNGRPLTDTEATAARRDENGACAEALDECEARLDVKRDDTGRRYPYARCDVVATAERFDDDRRYGRDFSDRDYGADRVEPDYGDRGIGGDSPYLADRRYDDGGDFIDPDSRAPGYANDALVCNYQACDARYQSFRESDCTFQPYEGPRRRCAL